MVLPSSMFGTLVHKVTRMVRNRNTGSEDAGEMQSPGGPFTRWFSWGHMGITLGLCTLLFNFWNNWRGDSSVASNERVRLEARIVVLETDMKHQADVDREQNAAVLREIMSLTQRIDAQREDIRQMQQLLVRHTDRGVSK